MARDIEASGSRPPILRRGVAGLVLLAVAVLAIHAIVGLALVVFWTVVAIAAVAGALWALNMIL